MTVTSLVQFKVLGTCGTERCERAS